MATLGESKKRILTISLEGTQRAQVAAMWDGSMLMVVELREFTGEPETWLPVMLEDIEHKVNAGWVVMIEDRTASLPTSAVAYNFDEMGENGRTHLQEALDWYFTLDGRGAIILDEGMKRYAIRRGGEGGLVDCAADEKGRLVYKIDWNHFMAGHKALLMAVVAAVQEEPLSEHWLRVMNNIPLPRRQANLWTVPLSLLKKYETDRQSLEKWVEETEAKKHVCN